MLAAPTSQAAIADGDRLRRPEPSRRVGRPTAHRRCHDTLAADHAALVDARALPRLAEASQVSTPRDADVMLDHFWTSTTAAFTTPTTASSSSPARRTSRQRHPSADLIAAIATGLPRADAASCGSALDANLVSCSLYRDVRHRGRYHDRWRRGRRPGCYAVAIVGDWSDLVRLADLRCSGPTPCSPRRACIIHAVAGRSGRVGRRVPRLLVRASGHTRGFFANRTGTSYRPLADAPKWMISFGNGGEIVLSSGQRARGRLFAPMAERDRADRSRPVGCEPRRAGAHP